MALLEYQHYYLVGIKGVAMAALAQCLRDTGKEVRGSDVPAEFVTEPLLTAFEIDTDFGAELPTATEVVIYTAAHQGKFNTQVLAAIDQGLPTYSHAQALAELFDAKKGLAVCGVGGKSTTSAMIAWILHQTLPQPTELSFAVGVGDIVGWHKTGQWSPTGEWFVAEADEYVIDPSARQRGEAITPRFSFMHPWLTVCTNIAFDHPDVYRDFAETKAAFRAFFAQIKPGGVLVAQESDRAVIEELLPETTVKILYFGTNSAADWQVHNFTSETGHTKAQVTFQKTTYTLDLQLPGHYNMLNAVAAVAAVTAIGVDPDRAIASLATFKSTKRRAEHIQTKNEVEYYDDYAHHPSEVAAVIQAYKEWYPNRRLVIGFQSHTFSRTKALFSQFIDSFAQADRVVMIDIFASARETADPTVTSDGLCQAINDAYPNLQALNVKTLINLAHWCQTELKPGDVFVTLGAGDIYKVHELL